MEQENTKHPELHIPLVERLKSIPEVFGIRVNEEPKYQTVLKDERFEIREYEPQIHAQVTLHRHSFDRFRELAFRKLAAYFFGGNTQKEKVAMTAPVMIQQGAVSTENDVPMNAPVLQSIADEDTWTMSFILPSKFNQFTAPTPMDPDIKIGVRPKHVVGVVTYSGNNSLDKIKDHERELNRWLSQQKAYQTIGRYAIAQYDAPFTIPFVKRNDVQIELQSMH